MMQLYMEALQRCLSSDRLRPYRKASKDDLEALACYCWNMALCEALYPALHLLEIGMRNTLHNSLAGNFKSERWFEQGHVLHTAEQQQIASVRESLRRRKKSCNAGNIVAELTFGFWTSLFNRRYENKWGARQLVQLIPTVPRPHNNLRALRNRLNKLRLLRNRVFHHEPIWHWSDLKNQHQQLLETIGWIDPSLQNLLRILDRFPEVCHNTYRHLQRESLTVCLSG